MGLKPWVTFENALQYSFLGFFGAIILAEMGWGFDHEWEVFTGSTEDTKHPKQIAHVCYGAAIFYVALTAFCGCQLGVHSRVAKGGNIQL
ncbi:hypothetical protein M408DRAFT_332511 [Serendipita vermifera MAFF 305830]|uniref:Uncharacterized protein n=1 Tax=Serendipita vermifera MAFF 305830 TaxID=933852 RepID=A0A0C3AV93_SERVB|nr:hypothetical protein M408DRAFT_332511 [Serendipita vermifera MAFF 305830]